VRVYTISPRHGASPMSLSRACKLTRQDCAPKVTGTWALRRGPAKFTPTGKEEPSSDRHIIVI
jgi:hypothetical protein